MIQKFLPATHETKRFHGDSIDGLELIVVTELWFGRLHRLVAEHCVSHMTTAGVRVTLEYNFMWDLCVDDCLIRERLEGFLEIEDDFDFSKHGGNTKSCTMKIKCD